MTRRYRARGPGSGSPVAFLLSAGFTLIEILVAVAILAVALAAVQRAGSLATDSARDTRARLAATWAASNRVAELRARTAFPAPASTKLDVDQAGQKLVIDETISDTPNPAIRRIDLAVSDAREPGRVLASVTAFVGRP